ESNKGPWSADFSPDGRLLASAHSDGVRLWDLAAGKEIPFIDQRQQVNLLGYIRSVIFQASGRSLITCGERGANLWPIEVDPQGANSGIRIGPPRLLLDPRENPENASPWWASLALDDHTLVIADYPSGRINVLNLKDFTRATFLGDPGTVFVTI